MNKKPFVYKVGVFLLGWIFKLYYNPKIIGKENIPKKGRAVIASNHIHLFDQCHILISTRRYIRYMAKKEYFDSPKTKWFFKSVGCIPVDRKNKDKNATNEAIKTLNNDGIIGIFPEGTRNALKDEKKEELYTLYFKDYDKNIYDSYINNNQKLSQINLLENLFINKKISKDEFFNNLQNPDKYLKENETEYYESLLLPFKYGAVSMASKTNSNIIPVIVKGDYKFRSKNLKVIIGKEIDIKNMDLESANKLLRSEMINLLKEKM